MCRFLFLEAHGPEGREGWRLWGLKLPFATKILPIGGSTAGIRGLEKKRSDIKLYRSGVYMCVLRRRYLGQR